MRIIVVGAGKVGTALCRSLVEEKHDVILNLTCHDLS